LKVIYNKLIPFGSFKAINIFGIVFAKNKMSNKDLNHEAIHTAQMKETLFILFYILYLVEWMVKLCFKGNAYQNLSFEKEAYKFQDNLNYLENRKPYSWVKYLLINKQ
jgi:hypothetical protein